MIDVKLLTHFGPISLDGCPVGLKEWPKFLDGHPLDNAWDDHSGVFRETLPGGVQTGEMTLIVKGRGVGAKVAEVMDSLRWGDDGFTVQAQSHGAEVRTLPVRLKEIGGVTWYPEPHTAVLAEIPLRVEYAPCGWEGETTVTELKDVAGRIVVPYAGDVPVWPELEIEGAVKIQLRDTDPVLDLPSGRYRVFTAPSERGVFTADGKPHVSTVVPFWAEPPRMVPGGMELFVTAKGSGNTARVKLKERWSKSWV